MEVYELVKEALEGEEEWYGLVHTMEGVTKITGKTCGPDRWIDHAARGKIDAINLLALIVSVLDDYEDIKSNPRLIVEGWADELYNAAKSGEIMGRDKDSLVPLKVLPEGFDWLVFADDADRFLRARGLKWTAGEMIAHLQQERKQSAVRDYDESDSVAIEFEGTVKPAQPALPAAEEGRTDLAEEAPVQSEKVAASNEGQADDALAALFDPVHVPQLETMFPDKKWSRYAEKAHRNGLVAARVGRGLFNPYFAAIWWMGKQAPKDWDWERCLKRLAKNLPPRSLDEKYRLTGEYE